MVLLSLAHLVQRWCGAEILWPGSAVPWSNRRPGHYRFRPGYEEIQRSGQVCHHHPRRSQSGRFWSSSWFPLAHFLTSSQRLPDVWAPFSEFKCFRVQAEEDVEEPQRHHQEHPGRHSLPWANHLQEHSQARSRLDAANYHRKARVWWSGETPPEFDLCQ